MGSDIQMIKKDQVVLRVLMGFKNLSLKLIKKQRIQESQISFQSPNILKIIYTYI